MTRRRTEYLQLHPDAPVLCLPPSFYPENWRGEEAVASPKKFLRITLEPYASGDRWKIEPGYDIENKQRYHSFLDFSPI